MRIVVVNYDEFGICKTKDEVLEDVIAYCKGISSDEKETWGNKLEKEFVKLVETREAEIVFADTVDRVKRAYIIPSIRQMEPDLLITYNLAGFEQSTLTDSFSYNLLDCRQLHIIEKTKITDKDILNKEKSINMFFYEKKNNG